LLNRPADRAFDYILHCSTPVQGTVEAGAYWDVDRNPAWLSEDAWVIVQIHPREFEPVELRNLEEFEQRTYGSNAAGNIPAALSNDLQVQPAGCGRRELAQRVLVSRYRDGSESRKTCP
jgi:hypothetical protein